MFPSSSDVFFFFSCIFISGSERKTVCILKKRQQADAAVVKVSLIRRFNGSWLFGSFG